MFSTGAIGPLISRSYIAKSRTSDGATNFFSPIPSRISGSWTSPYTHDYQWISLAIGDETVFQSDKRSQRSERRLFHLIFPTWTLERRRGI